MNKKWTAVYGSIIPFILVLSALLTLSCPNPIDTTLALKVEDDAPPVITIITPDQGTTNYYESTIEISGVIKDSTDSDGKADGSVKEVFYEEQYNKRINGTINIASDGSFSFSFSTISPEQLSGTQYIVIIAIDWNDNIAEKVVTLYDKTTGPRITVYDHGPGDYNVYTSNTSSSVPASVATLSIQGIVGLPTFYLKYDVEPDAGPLISDRDIVPDPVTGDFSFNFTPRDEGVSGELRFVLRAFDGKDSSTVFILTDDPLPPDLAAATVAGDNTYLDLSFSEGIYHNDGTAPQAVDFSLSPVSGGTATAVSFSPVVFAITPSAGDDFIRLNIDVTGTPDGNESFDIIASDLRDEVGNPISIGQDSINLLLHDKAQPWVTRVYTEPAIEGGAFNSGDIPIRVEFNEPIDETTISLSLALNTGVSADFSDDMYDPKTAILIYTVQPGHNVDPLNYETTTDLTGSAADLEGNGAILTLPGFLSPDDLGEMDLRIDTTDPAAPGVDILDTDFDGTEGITKTESEQGVGFTITGEAGAWYEITETNCTVDGATSGVLGDLGTTLSVSGITTGNVSLSVTQRDLAGNTGPAGSDTVPADLTAPNPPDVTHVEADPTNSSTPTWNWTSGGNGGISTFRYSFDEASWLPDDNGDTSTTYSTSLAHGSHTLYVQEKNVVGNWSESGSESIVVDLIGPSPAPTVGGLAGVRYTSDKRPTWIWSSNDAVDGIDIFQYNFDGTGWSTETTDTSFQPGYDLEQRDYILVVQERDQAGNWSASGSYTITVDWTGPSIPTVTGNRYTNVTKPTWTWTSNGDTGSGTYDWYRYSDDESDWQPSDGGGNVTSYTSGSALSDDDYILYVQEKDNAGNWSVSGEFTITVDTTDPAAPTNVTASTADGKGTSGDPTTDRTPTWSWESGGDGTAGPGVSGASGWYRYNIDGGAWSTETTAENYTPGTMLDDGAPTFYVQEKDNAGNWSGSGELTVDIDGAPNAPIVGGVTPTTDTTPTWNWSSGGNSTGGTKYFRYQLDSENSGGWSTETTATTYTPGSPLSGTHTLYVQERDENFYWSESGSRTITIQ